MRRRRVLLPLAAALVTILLASGCVKQSFDESQLEATEQAPGVAAQRLDARQARRAALKARKAKPTKTHGGKDAGQGKSGGGDGPRGDEPDGAATDDETGGRKQAGGGDAGERTPRSSTADEDGGVAPPARRQAPPFRVIGKVADEQGDPSGSSPAYADVRQLLLESNGSGARVTVAVAGRIPRVLADGEVQGIGIDFYRSDDRESDFQLFVTGNSGGWEAFLHTPQGVESYPGRFAIGGRVLVFQLPWAALGGRKAAEVGMFVDWSQERTLLNAVGNDRAPDDGRITVNPA